MKIEQILKEFKRKIAELYGQRSNFISLTNRKSSILLNFTF